MKTYAIASIFKKISVKNVFDISLSNYNTQKYQGLANPVYSWKLAVCSSVFLLPQNLGDWEEDPEAKSSFDFMRS